MSRQYNVTLMGERMRTAAVEFWKRTIPEPNSGCLLWTGGCTEVLGNPFAYGIFCYQYKRTLAHRYAWEITHGAVPPDKIVCHRCDTPLCVNAEHLFLGTPKDNTDDMVRKGRSRGFEVGHSPAPREPKTHCKHGHEFTRANTYVFPDGTRNCRTCRRKWSRAKKARRRERVGLNPYPDSLPVSSPKQQQLPNPALSGDLP